MHSDWQPSKWQEFEDLAWGKLEVGDHTGARHAALKAIALEPDAIDCYVILAQLAHVVGQKQAYAREAVRLGEVEFEQEIAAAPSDEFPFWGITRTRPYMRGLHTLALSLWEDSRKGAKEEAIEIALHMLRICPNDNIGMRFLLPEWLARQGRWSIGQEVLADCGDNVRTEMSMWAALYAFKDGNLDKAAELVASARKANPYMVGQLLLKRHPKRTNEQWVAAGSIEEAKAHAVQAYDLWRSLEGGEKWLSQFPQR
ncbi:hypothetical protein JANAI62_35770 [Jannaschia pagri]|uniref:Tetratricopeptide repeat-containing protein n=1 Tax=Jannaschia pagri TaxID=2829797 RepID=A0ABQ4NRC2_9RHOB|nr:MULTISPECIES: hypothetical protein [unclassified Jannaschia]GIT93139.1 hypothetical protein JANAI61_35970 [Jannaschia sp. AI_61]GIT96954.1 hypothetical protein JANAI62_35770 [Jannaschia sp. AI_62]